MKPEHLSTKTITFRFREDIEKVYKCFDDREALEKIGLTENLYTLLPQPVKTPKPFFTLKTKTTPLSSFTLYIDKKKENQMLKQKITIINDEPLTSNFIVKISFYQNIEENSTMTIFELSYSKNDRLSSLISDGNFIKEFCYKTQHWLTHSAKCTIHNESIVIFRPFNMINEQVLNFNELLKMISQKRRIEQIGESGKVGTCYIMINQNKAIETKYTVRNIIRREDKTFYRVEKEIVGQKRKSMFLNFNIIQLSSISCYFSIESEITFYIDGKYLSCLAQYHQMLLKKFKKDFESYIFGGDNRC